MQNIDVYKRQVYNRVAAMREVGGEDLDIIIEMHSNTDTTAAIQIGHALEDLRIFYYEEPCHPLNVQNMVEVRNAVNIPIATGERIYTRWGYRDFFEKRAIEMCIRDRPYYIGGTIQKRNKLLLQTPESMKERFNVEAVSYTHLDVYKRQVEAMTEVVTSLVPSTQDSIRLWPSPAKR